MCSYQYICLQISNNFLTKDGPKTEPQVLNDFATINQDVFGLYFSTVFVRASHYAILKRLLALDEEVK